MHCNVGLKGIVTLGTVLCVSRLAQPVQRHSCCGSLPSSLALGRRRHCSAQQVGQRALQMDAGSRENEVALLALHNKWEHEHLSICYARQDT